VEEYKAQNFQDQPREGINLLRETIFREVMEKAKTLDLQKTRILTLTAPTGSGKTLTSFSLALILRERMEKEFGYLPRIIYALPFITIIDQNPAFFEQVLSLLPDFHENISSYLLAHHHLTDIHYREGGEEKEFDVALSLIESWEAEVIVTTFIQLLHSVIGCKNSFLRKYHHLARSIILLDEVQNIPAEYWPLVRSVFVLLTKYLGCTLILMTATKPLIFHEGEAVELLDRAPHYFHALSRVTIYPRLEKSWYLDEFVEWFQGIYQSSRSYLMVLNTIRSSVEVYEKLKKRNLPNLFYLSGNLIPRDKLERIRKVKELLEKGEKPILLSTQVVEAGVDLDFDVAIRDLGPLDSIIQVAGRCNRNFKRGKNAGEVWVVSLWNEKEREYAPLVYLKTLPLASRNLLENLSSITEGEILELVEKYFTTLKMVKSFDESEDLYQALLHLRFYAKDEKSVSDFELIKQQGIIYPVFIEKDEEARQVWQEFIRINEDETQKPWEKKRKFLTIRSRFTQYVVNVRLTGQGPTLLEIFFKEELGYVPYQRVPEFYDPEMGFRHSENYHAFFL